MADAENVFDMIQGWNSLAAEMLYAYMVDGAPEKELSFYEPAFARTADSRSTRRAVPDDTSTPPTPTARRPCDSGD